MFFFIINFEFLKERPMILIYHEFERWEFLAVYRLDFSFLHLRWLGALWFVAHPCASKHFAREGEYFTRRFIASTSVD